jgi:cell fate regulator YaaT (PSP1 superfamily)
MADIVQVALRGSRKGFFLNSRNLWLQLRDPVVVQAENGEVLGSVFLKDARLIELKRPSHVTREIIRKATEEDLDQEDHNRAHEGEAFEYCRERIGARALKMELAEAEVAFTGHRITFYFSADQRVDFRELVKDLASKFRTRIELRQIGARDEAKRLDGIGRCGRQLCIASWLPEGRPVSLSLAKDQGLSLNPTQISGPCGRLLCCLHYEHDFYVQQRKRFPKEGKLLRAPDGSLERVQAIDIFRERVTLRAEDGSTRVVPLEQLTA